MDSSYDIVIVGTGLAGAFAAVNLTPRRQVLVLEQSEIASGATGAGAGLVNPFMARKANPVWHWKESVASLERTLRIARQPNLFRKTGVFRPAIDIDQVEWFKETASDHPDVTTWVAPADVTSRWPAVKSEYGGLFIRSAGSVDLVSLAEGLLNASTNLGCEIHDETAATAFDEVGDEVVLETNRGDVKTRLLILCPGADFDRWKVLAGIPLHRLKGQTVVVQRPYRIGAHLPCLSGSGYVVPYPDELVLGSTHHHDFEDREPTREDTLDIIQKVSQMLPIVSEAKILSAAAGVRVTVPKTRLPIVGPVTDSGRVWVLTGLGSKGVLMGAFIGESLPGYLKNPESIPEELQVRREVN